MTNELIKQNEPMTREEDWKKVVWKICRPDDEGRCNETFERYSNHLILSGDFADVSLKKAEKIKQRVLKKMSSPIEYYMYKRLLDPKYLAQAMGITVWRLKRHFKPNVFKKLDRGVLQKYAKIFNVRADDLINFRGEP